MATYLISYDLRKQGQNYAALHEAIKKLGSWWHCLDSTWIINCYSSASSIRDTLTRHIDSNDSLLVTTLSGEAAWAGFSPDCAEWLRKHL